MSTSARFVSRIAQSLSSRSFLALLAAGLFVVGGLASVSGSAEAAVGINKKLNYQGRLLNAAGAVVPDGNYNIQFKIYQDGAGTTAGNPGGTLEWTEEWLNNNTQGVVVKNGYFSVALGTITTTLGSDVDFNQDTLWLSVNVGNTNGTCTPFTSCGGDGEMLPMKRMSAAPYALQAANASALGGIASSGFIQNIAPNLTQQTANFNIVSGAAANVATAQIQGPASATAPVLVVKGGVTPGSGGDLLQLQTSGSAVVVRASSSGAVTLQNSTDSTSAFAVNTSTGGTNQAVLTVDTTNEKVSIGAPLVTANAKLQVYTSSLVGLRVYENANNINVAEFAATGVGPGTAAISTGSPTVTGTNTTFTASFKVGDTILVNSGTPQLRTVSVIGSDTSITVTTNFTTNGSGVSYVEGAGAGAGTIASTSGSAAVVGTGTSFTTTFKVGDVILVNSEAAKVIATITNNTNLTTATNFANTLSGVAYSRSGYDSLTVRQISTSINTNGGTAGLTVQAAGVGQTGLAVQAANGQTADLMALQNSAGTTLTRFDSAGNLKVAGSVDTHTATGLTVGGIATGITIQAAASGSINIGTNAVTGKVVNIGSVASTVNTTTVHIADTTDATNAQAITIGSTAANTGNLSVIQGGSNTTQAIQLLPNTAGGVMIGAGAGTGTITVGQSTASNTISVGSANPGASSTQTINIGNGVQTTASSAINVNILSGAAGSDGTATLNLADSDRVTVVDIGNVVADAARTLNVFTGNATAVDTINIGTGATTVAGGKTIHIGDGVPTASGSNLITIGSTALASATTIQAGTGNLLMQTNSASASIIAKSQTDSATAFQVQEGGNVPVFNVDTVNQRVAVRALTDVATANTITVDQRFNNATYWTNCAGGAGGWTGTATTTQHNTGNIVDCVSTNTNFTVTAGVVYEVGFTITGMTTGAVKPRIGGADGQTITLDNTLAHTQLITAADTTNLRFVPTSNFNGTISAVTVRTMTASGATFVVKNSNDTAAIEVRTGGAGKFTTAIGTNAFRYNVSGSDNTVLGDLAMELNTSGSNNTAIGSAAMQLNTNGTDNTALGYGAQVYARSGQGNTSLGALSGHQLIAGLYNSAVGYEAGSHDTDNFYSFDTNNSTAIGARAQTQASNALVLGGAGSHAVKVGIGTSDPTNTMSVSPFLYNSTTATTATQSGTAITASSGTPFTAAMVGSEMTWGSGGAKQTITAYGGGASSATATGSVNQTVNPAQTFRVHHAGLQVTSAGNVGIGTVTPTTLFQVQDTTGGFTLFSADSANNRVQVGSSTTDANAVTLVLDSYNNATDPTGVNGAMYYNSSLKNFRCYENGSWKNCISGLIDQDAFWVRASFRTGGDGFITVGIDPVTVDSNVAPAAGHQSDGNYTLLTTAGVSGDRAGIVSTSFDIVRAGWNPTCSINLRSPASITTGFRVFAGLFSAAPANASNAGGNHIAFKYSDTDATGGWRATTRDGTTNTIGAANVGGSSNVAANTTYQLKFRVDSSSGTVYMSVNGGTEDPVTANLPANTQDLGIAAQIISSNTTGDSWIFGRFACEQS